MPMTAQGFPVATRPMTLHVATDDGRYRCRSPPPVLPQMPYIISSSMMAPMLSYGFSFEAWTLFPDEQPTTSDLIHYDLNHIGFLHQDPEKYPDINAHIVTYCKRIDNLLHTADEKIMPADVRDIVAVLTGYMQYYANAAVLRVTELQTTLNLMPLLLPTPTLTPRLNCNPTPTLPMILPSLLTPAPTPKPTPEPTSEPTPASTHNQTPTPPTPNLLPHWCNNVTNADCCYTTSLMTAASGATGFSFHNTATNARRCYDTGLQHQNTPK